MSWPQKEMMQRFNALNHAALCDRVSSKDAHLQSIIDRHGYPPVWTRPQSFAALIRIILEQQVSLASAKAAFLKLKSHLGAITPEDIDTDRRRIPGLLLQQAKDHVRQASRGSHRVETIAIKTDGPPGG